MERTLLIIKPDGVQRGLIGEIIKRIENKRLKITKLKMETISLEKARKHYEIHKEKSFYLDLINFIISGAVVLIVIEGESVVEIIRNMAGKTNPKDSEYGTIRGDYSNDILKNVVHTSDSFENAENEIENFFS